MGTIRRRKNGKLFIDFRDGSGRRVREFLGDASEKLAGQVLRKREAEVLEGRYFPNAKQERVLFKDHAAEVLKYCLERNRAKGFYEFLIKRLTADFGDKYLTGITTLDVVAYQSKRASEVSKSSVNRELAVLKRIFNLGIMWGKVRENPVKGVQFFKEPVGRLRFLSKEEITRLLENCSGHLKQMVVVALHTGMRRGELLKLKVKDIDFDNGLINLEHTKNGERREVPMSGKVRGIFWTLSTGKGKEDYFFTTRHGNAFRSVRTAFNHALARAGIEGFRWHDLRHTFASQMVMAGVDITTVQKLLGHKTLAMTLRYSHLSAPHKQAAIDKLETSLLPEVKAEDLGHHQGTGAVLKVLDIMAS